MTQQSTGDYVLGLSRANFTNKGAVGGKGASLGELLTEGIAVPDGFVITTAAFRELGKPCIV